MRIIIYIAIILFIPGKLFAQAPGYMGKKILLGINYQYAPMYGNLLFDAGLIEGAKFSDALLPGPKLSIEAKIVISTYSTIGFGVAHQQILLAKNHTEFNYNAARDIRYKNISTDVISISTILSEHTHHVAPVGFYKSLGVSLILLNTTFERENLPTANLGSVDVALTSGFGTRRVIKDRIGVDLGMDINFNFMGFYHLIEGSFGNGHFEREMQNRAVVTNFFNNLVGFRAGIYYLL